MRLKPITLSQFTLLLLTLLWLLGGFVASKSAAQSAASATPIADPVVAKITKSGLAIKLVEFVTVPATNRKQPRARITFTAHANDKSGRIFTNDMRGKLYVVKNGSATPYLELKTRLPNFVDKPGIGTGFQFFTFHPDFAHNGKFYTVHSEVGNAITSTVPDFAPRTPYTVAVHGVLTEWTTRQPSADAFAGTQRTLLRIGFRAFNHNFQQIDFNPNAKLGDSDYAMLYISLGDGEEQGTWSDAPQNLSVPFGKILRIDPAGKNGKNGQYGIPKSNPFAKKPSELGEIWAYGLRNPHRFSWDTGGGKRMLITNIGERNIEAIYWGKAGANYGWNLREGPFLFKHDDPIHVYPLPADDSGFTYPIAMYDHDDAPAIVGGYVYRGAAIPALQGKYVFGDIVDGRIFYTEERDMKGGALAKVYEITLLDAKGVETTLYDLVKADVPEAERVDLRFGLDAQGELLVSSKRNGKIWRMENEE